MFADEGFSPARLIGEVGPFFQAVTESGVRTAEMTGRLRHLAQSRAELPAVGDWVALRLASGSQRSPIFAILPRRTALSRKAAGSGNEPQVVAANVDTVFLMTGLDLDFNVRRIERGVLLARESGAEPVIVLSKADLCADPEARAKEVERVAPGVSIVPISSKTQRGLTALAPWLRPGSTIVLFGSSGTGKSTLVNTLLGEARRATRAVRSHDHRGKHTTSQRELLVLPSGALLIDTPGIRELGLLGGEEGALSDAFRDIELLATHCAFRDCTHQTEPDCAVKEAIASGALAQERLESYKKLAQEIASLQQKSGRLEKKSLPRSAIRRLR